MLVRQTISAPPEYTLGNLGLQWPTKKRFSIWRPATTASQSSAKSRPRPVYRCSCCVKSKSGTYLLPFRCEWRDGAWFAVEKTKPLEATVVVGANGAGE